jgi:2-polyprenyl-3-methyl-5-hydroxy-6-metoxy-1,4-benzoquinol methylase
VVVDLDAEPDKVCDFAGKVDVVLCGEILEHLSNPGRLLDAVRKLAVPIIVTVPNAFSSVGMRWIAKAKENVNKEHVAWYSYHTLKTLLERHGYELAEFFWYKGKPLVAEGLVVLAR